MSDFKYLAILIAKILGTVITAVIMTMGLASLTFADTRFVSSYPCSDASKSCVSSGTRKVGEFEVHRDCWEWSYTKTCNYPSKNNCNRDCYLVAFRECLLQDSLGNCVNQLKEFSCKRWEPVNLESQKVRIGLEAKDGPETVVCKGIPCIDGNCVDKSYLTNGEMMDSVTKLYVVNQAKGATDLNFKLFAGTGQHCSKKATSYTNCCATAMGGWGKHLGARCTEDERQLMDNRKKNLCAYVGKVTHKKIGYTTLVKHHWCCFGSLLFKVIQVEGRKQLGMTFGTGERPDCRGLTLEEIMRLDFSRMDFSEFIEDFKAKFFGKYKSPLSGDMTMRVKGSIPNIRKYDNNPDNRENNKTGWVGSVVDDSWEAEEEKRLEEERLARIAEEKRLAEERRLAELKRQEEERRQAEIRRKAEEQRIAEEKRKAEEVRQRENRKIAKEQELQRAKERLKQLEKPRDDAWNNYTSSDLSDLENRETMWNNFVRADRCHKECFIKIHTMEQDLKDGKY